jgi:hypothetical protein
MYQRILYVLLVGVLMPLVGCTSYPISQEETQTRESQKETRPWHRNEDTVGGEMEKRARAKRGGVSTSKSPKVVIWQKK